MIEEKGSYGPLAHHPVRGCINLEDGVAHMAINDDRFDSAIVALHHNAAAADTSAAYPRDLDRVLSAADGERARAIIGRWEGYAPTELRALDGLAEALGIAGLYYKDESRRFGLASFKALGGAYAVLRLLAEEIGERTGRAVSDEDIGSGRCADLVEDITVVTATDGNHGRAVAWGARRFGCRCVIHVHAGVSAGRTVAMEALGATVLRVDGDYDDSVRQAATDAAAQGWFVVSDTSYDGYTALPRQVMAGYTILTAEIAAQLPAGVTPSHVFVQGGVGGLAAAVCAHLWQSLGALRPRFVVVEPDRADCLFQSAKNGRPTTVDIVEETVMAGLSCGAVSWLGWQILASGANDFMTIGDDTVAPAMRLLADGGAGDNPVVAGESAVAGLAGLIAARRQPARARALGLDRTARVLVIGTEGATDPALYRALVGRTPEAVMARQGGA